MVYAENVRCLRDLQVRFHENAIESIAENDRYFSNAQEPLLMIYDSKVTSCPHLLANACAEEFPHDRLYGESLAIALMVALLNAAKKPTTVRAIGGLAPWQLRLAERIS
jgi:hypothetical protein